METSVWSSACEVANEVQMVVVVVETWKVVVGRCAGRASGAVPKSEVTAWMGTVVECVAGQVVPT